MLGGSTSLPSMRDVGHAARRWAAGAGHDSPACGFRRTHGGDRWSELVVRFEGESRSLAVRVAVSEMGDLLSLSAFFKAETGNGGLMRHSWGMPGWETGAVR